MYDECMNACIRSGVSTFADGIGVLVMEWTLRRPHAMPRERPYAIEVQLNALEAQSFPGIVIELCFCTHTCELTVEITHLHSILLPRK